MGSKLGRNLIQVNILMPNGLKESIQKIARIRSVEQNRDVSYLDLIREELVQLAILSGSYIDEEKINVKENKGSC